MEVLRKRSCGTLSVDGTAGEFAVVFYDPKVSGEASHRPVIRQPPSWEEHYSKLIKMVVGALARWEPSGAGRLLHFR